MTLEIIGTIVGIIYLWLEYKASIYLWAASIVMPAIYIFVYYDAGLYADFGINIYYLGATIYGWLVWKYGGPTKEQEELPITHMPAKNYIKAVIAFAIAFIVIAKVLIYYTDSNVPWCDAFTTALSIIGMWMLARKYVEQWWVWMIVDVACVGLYTYKELYFTATLYALYAIVAIFGWMNWKKIMGSSTPQCCHPDKA